MSVSFTCKCCGHTQTFKNITAAYGWTLPGWSAVGPLCDLCPVGTYARWGTVVSTNGWAEKQGVLRDPEPDEKIAHAEVHRRWEQEGRPHFFDPKTCL